jgi:hypothetical protein
MKVTNKELRRIIREERNRLLTERDDTLDRYADAEYADYEYGDPQAAAFDMIDAIGEMADVVARMLPEAGGALEPGMRASILPTIVKALADRGIRVK